MGMIGTKNFPVHGKIMGKGYIEKSTRQRKVETIETGTIDI